MRHRALNYRQAVRAFKPLPSSDRASRRNLLIDPEMLLNFGHAREKVNWRRALQAVERHAMHGHESIRKDDKAAFRLAPKGVPSRRGFLLSPLATEAPMTATEIVVAALLRLANERANRDRPLNDKPAPLRRDGGFFERRVRGVIYHG
jgi:hypothetical protein